MSRGIKALLTFIGLVNLTVAALALLARWMPLSNNVILVLAVGSPYLALGAPAALAVFALCRRWLLGALAGAVTVAALAVQLPWYYGGDGGDSRDHVKIRVLSSNLSHGHADPDFLVELAQGHADLIAVQELTATAARQLAAAGIAAQFPYSILHPAPAGGGVGLWSRFPLESTYYKPQRKPRLVSARIQHSGVLIGPIFASVHVTPPYPKPIGDWRGDIEATGEALRQLADAAGAGSVIVAGDFNSTPDMRGFRELLRSTGYREAVEQAGAGFLPTFPSHGWSYPLVNIDHVLTRAATASSARTITVPRTDHRSLLAVIDVPVDPTAS